MKKSEMAYQFGTPFQTETKQPFRIGVEEGPHAAICKFGTTGYVDVLKVG